jgi:hypothetical protein
MPGCGAQIRRMRSALNSKRRACLRRGCVVVAACLPLPRSARRRPPRSPAAPWRRVQVRRAGRISASTTFTRSSTRAPTRSTRAKEILFVFDGATATCRLGSGPAASPRSGTSWTRATSRCSRASVSPGWCSPTTAGRPRSRTSCSSATSSTSWSRRAGAPPVVRPARRRADQQAADRHLHPGHPGPRQPAAGRAVHVRGPDRAFGQVRSQTCPPSAFAGEPRAEFGPLREDMPAAARADSRRTALGVTAETDQRDLRRFQRLELGSAADSACGPMPGRGLCDRRTRRGRPGGRPLRSGTRTAQPPAAPRGRSTNRPRSMLLTATIFFWRKYG